jgi:UDP-GlcNAc:undecaprenyl-phosphate/decaprenyl-phosphate GlcNAc-1-phosphate transferase
MPELHALAFAGGLIMTAVCLAIYYPLAKPLGLVDEPSGRKKHQRPTPIIGGLALFTGAVFTSLVVLLIGPPQLPQIMSSHVGYLAGALLLALMGFWDDRHPIPARIKLLTQMIACVLAVTIDQALIDDVYLNVAGFDLRLGPAAAPFSVLVMLTLTNSINMIDGADGLAGGIMLIALAIMAKATMAAGLHNSLLIVALIGSLSAFLVVNLPLRPSKPALVFMGDCGSVVLGFTLAYFAIELSALPNRVFKPATALWFFFIPVADTIWLYLRRVWKARAPFAPGRDHIHHLLIERFGAPLAVWILLAVSALMAGSAYLAERLYVKSIWLITAWIVAFVIYGALTHKPWLAAWERREEH